MLRELIIKNRSYRRFFQEVEISTEQIWSWIELARFSASGMNMQPLKYIVSNTPDKNALVFETLGWAGYLKDWQHPAEGERPSAYLVQLLDTNLAKQFFCDDGIAMQSILLGAIEDGFGGCIFRSIKKDQLRINLNIPNHLEIINVVALGHPKEIVILEDSTNNDIKYYRDHNNAHHVPKRPLDELILDL